MIGKTISHYQILEKLGEGGMGVVYKAEDTKLKRTVALKFLPANVLQRKNEKARFMREAQAAAALNHANIAHIYAIEEAEGRMFIAMEYVDGQSLHELLGSDRTERSKPLPLDKAIDYTFQIATGIKAAHEKGVVHRDIKCANIMVTGEGVIKIMDFGLAKLGDRSKMTFEGSTMGTVAYMSPEQAQGEEVDNRTDIWSLGVVLYELISGQLPFKGDYEQAVIYSILNSDPEPLTALRSSLPLAIDGIIYKALAKDPAIRYQHVDEVPADLKALERVSGNKSGMSKSMLSPVSRIGVPGRPASPALKWLMIPLVIFILAAGFLAAWFLKPSPSAPERQIKRFTLTPAEGERFTRSYAVSPDGTILAYIARDEQGQRIYTRKMNTLEALPLEGTENARRVFFSADCRWLGFLVSNQLMKIPVYGGSVGSLMNLDLLDWEFHGAYWGHDGSIILGSKSSGLQQISSSGGDLEEITRIDTTTGEVGHRFPLMLPGEKHLLFTNVYSDKQSIAILSLETGKYRTLLDKGGRVLAYVPTGHILFLRSKWIMAVPFDMNRLKVTGPLIQVFDEIVDGAVITNDGTLYFDRFRSGESQRLVWVDRNGKSRPILEQPGMIRWPRISPDGKKIAFGFKRDLWVYQTDRKVRSRLATDNAGEIVWAPDGNHVVYWKNHSSHYNLFWNQWDGSGDEEPILMREEDTFASSWTPDGRTLLYYFTSQENRLDIARLHLESDPEVLISTPFDEKMPVLSPDGNWLAYVSNESGRDEIYVQPYPALDRRWLVSDEGGNEPMWAKHANELYYRNGYRMKVVSYDTGPEFQPDVPRTLFEGEYAMDMNTDHSYDITDDGERFVMVENWGSSRVWKIHVVLNWFDVLKRLEDDVKR